MVKLFEEKLSQASSKQQNLLKKLQSHQSEFEKSKESLLLEKLSLQESLDALTRQTEQSCIKEMSIIEKIKKLASSGESKSYSEIEFLAKSLLKEKKESFSKGGRASLQDDFTGPSVSARSQSKVF